MNIWILNHHAREEGRHPSLSRELVALGENVTLFSSSFIHNDYIETKEYGNDFYNVENINGYKRVYIKTLKYRGNGYKRLLNQLQFTWRTYRAGIKEYKGGNKPDIIIGSSVHLFTGLAGYLIAKKLRAKFVFEIRDLWPQTLVDLGALKEKSLIARLFYRLEKFLYIKADKIISVLPDANNYIESKGVNGDKIIHIPNGIDIDYMDKSLADHVVKEEVKNEYNEYKNQFTVTFTGAHGIANGLNTIVDAAKILQDEEARSDNKTYFIFVGEGPEKDNLIKQAKTLGLNNIVFKPRVNKYCVPHILANSDVCIFHLTDTPVFKYGISSNKIFDYMYSSRPVIFAVNASNDFAELANCGITVPPENPTQLAKAIASLKKLNSQELNEMGTNGKMYVHANHSFHGLAKKLQKNLNDLYRD